MPLTNDALTQDELDFLIYATLSEAIGDKDVIPLDRVDTPLFNLLWSKKKGQGDPVRGGFRYNVKGQRGQKLTWWDGLDILPFEERYVGNAMRFYVGKYHLGDTLPFDVLERAGLRIDYNRGIREGGMSGSKAKLEVLVNAIKENKDDIRYNIKIELAKHVYKDNADAPKAFTGLAGLLPPTSATGGTVGGMSRANPLFQHTVSTGWTGDNALSNFSAMATRLQRRSNGRKVDVVSVGQNVYDLYSNIFNGGTSAGGAANATQSGKWDWQRMQDKAGKMGEKFRIGLPQDAFMYQDTLIMLDPVIEDLHRENPAYGWRSLGWMLTTDYLFLVPVMSDVVVPHNMPYNQRVQHTSYHGEMTMVSVCPNAQGVFSTSYAGLGF